MKRGMGAMSVMRTHAIYQIPLLFVAFHNAAWSDRDSGSGERAQTSFFLVGSVALPFGLVRGSTNQRTGFARACLAWATHRDNAIYVRIRAPGARH
jgi:hypothetical protein